MAIGAIASAQYRLLYLLMNALMSIRCRKYGISRANTP